MNQFEEAEQDRAHSQKRGQERPFTPAAYTQPGRPTVPYVGNGAYCYANSLHICLTAAGADPLPEPGFLECLTLMPFGATFARFGRRLAFFPSPPNNDPETGLSLALANLGWDCQQWHGRLFEAKEALERLRAAVATGPVLLGPVDMGHLRYDPASLYKRGEDHYLVVLALDETAVVVHDPQGFPFATLPLDDLMAGWRAEKIGYVDHAYNLRYDFCQREQVSRAQIVTRTLPRLRQQATGPPAESGFQGGVAAYRQLVHILKQRVPDTFQAALVHFALPLGARRCLDGAWFLDEAGLPEAAACLAQKSSLYGRAQYYAVQKRWPKVISIVEELVEAEDCFVKALSQHGTGGNDADN